MAPDTFAPFRAEHMGSFLRPAALLAERKKRDAGEASAAQLDTVTDAAVREIVKVQTECGFHALTDGEYR